MFSLRSNHLYFQFHSQGLVKEMVEADLALMKEDPSA